MMNKRKRRREKREEALGPLKELVSIENDLEVLSCGHTQTHIYPRQHGPGKIFRHCERCEKYSESEKYPESYDPAERAREKQASREQNEQEVLSGQKSREQIHRENAHFSTLKIRVNFAGAKSLG